MSDEQTAPPTDETKQRARRLAEGFSSRLDDEKLGKYGQSAHGCVDNIREEFPGVDALVHAKVAIVLAKVVAELSRVPAGFLSDFIEDTATSYSLAAGALADVYALPEREERKDSAELNQELADALRAKLQGAQQKRHEAELSETELANTGQYL